MILGKAAQRVVAVEANAHCVDVARRNISLNGIENVELIYAAGASRSGTLTFAGSDLLAAGKAVRDDVLFQPRRSRIIPQVRHS